jgi:hypothetical protein
MSSNGFDHSADAFGRRYGRRVFMADAFLISFLCCCLNKTPTVPADNWVSACLHTPDTTQPIDSVNDPQYRIISPNGNETFHGGQECKVIATCKISGSAKIYIVFGRYKLTPPGFDVFAKYMTGNGAIDTAIFTVPDTFFIIDFNSTTQQNDTVRVCSSTDSCSIEIENYSHPQYNDYSDCCFRIQNP